MKTSDDKYHATPAAFLESLGFWGPRTLAAHAVHLTPADIEILAKRGVGVAHNPESNMKLASGIAPVEAMRKAGIAVGLGTDGAASNNDLDMFEAMRQAAFLHKLVAADPRAIPAPVALEMATIGGARAMGMDKEIGSLEPGKRADLIVVSMASRAADADVRPRFPHRLRHARRRCADDHRQRQGPDAGPEGPHPRPASGAHRRRSLRGEGPRRRQVVHMATTNVLISEADIKQRIVSLAAEIERDYPKSDEIHLVAILKGGFMFMADLVRAMSDRVTMDFMAVSSYGKGTTSSGQVRVLKDLESNLEARHIIVVEDIVDTGLTLHYLQDLLKARAPKSMKTACLLSKPSRRKVDVQVDYIGFTIEDHFVVGYGLDYAEKYRNLPYIAILEQ